MDYATGALCWTCSRHQFEKVAILKFVVKLVINPKIFSTVARQPALTWQKFSTQIVARGLKSYHPSMKRIRSPSTELWHILAVCMQDDVPVWPWPLTYFTQNWVTWPGGRVESMRLFGSLQTFSFLKYSSINCIFSGPVARQPALPWQPFCAALVGVSSPREPPSVKLM